jgi:hypothetical protein
MCTCAAQYNKMRISMQLALTVKYVYRYNIITKGCAYRPQTCLSLLLPSLGLIDPPKALGNIAIDMYAQNSLKLCAQ